MNRPLSLLLALVCLNLTAGCVSLRKNPKQTENPAIAAELEESFRQRWIEKRAGELTAKGVSADLARTQAIEEFKGKFNFPEPKTK